MPNPYDPDDIRLSINGTEWRGWTGATLTMSADAIADAFSLSLPFDPSSAAQRAAFAPASYQPVKLYIGDDLVLTGRIDKVSPTGTGQPLTVEGRALPGILADCSIVGDLEYNGLTLAQIARKLCKSLGVSVRADTDSDPIDEARANYGDTPASFLAQLAGPRHILLNSSYSGELVISAGSALIGKAPVAHLVEGESGPGETPIIGNPSASYDGSRLYSVYRVATQFAGEPDIVGEATDSAIKLYRPRLAVASESDSAPTKTAARLRSESIAAAIACEVKVSGWRRPDGKRWAERQAVTLKAPGAMVYSAYPYIIASLVHTLTAGDRSTTLRLGIPETYTGRSPSRYPWA